MTVDYDEAIDWLFGTQRFGIKLGLENVRRLLKASEVSLEGPTFYIHVAGTNGKGSVCAFMDSICRQAGLRTGLFTSPHLIEFGERIRFGGEIMPREQIVDGLIRLRDLTKNWKESPTFFEFTTALALRYFQEQKAEIVILEAGMGGRLDATNVVRPIVSVITPISLDHQRWLGNELEDIANEKAGIIKPERPVVSGPQVPRVASVLKKTAKVRGSELTFVDEKFEGKIAMRGEIQRHNAALAAAAIRMSGLGIDERSIEEGLARTEWKGRFQRVQPDVVIDGAHNPAAMKVTASAWREEFGEEKATVVLGVLADKDIVAILGELAAFAAEIVTVPVRSLRAATAKDLKKLVMAAVPKIPVQSADNLLQAMEKARATKRPVMIAGSLFLAGEALAMFEGRPEDLQDSQQ